MTKIKAKIVELPAAWNTNHWIVETQNKQRIYFSDKALKHPSKDLSIGDEGVVYKHYLNDLESSYVYCWEADK